MVIFSPFFAILENDIILNLFHNTIKPGKMGYAMAMLTAKGSHFQFCFSHFDIQTSTFSGGPNLRKKILKLKYPCKSVWPAHMKLVVFGSSIYQLIRSSVPTSSSRLRQRSYITLHFSTCHTGTSQCWPTTLCAAFHQQT